MIILADEANQSTREGYTNELYHLNLVADRIRLVLALFLATDSEGLYRSLL